MSRKYEERVDITPRKWKVVVERNCDLCGAKANTKDWNETSSYGEINDTEIKMSIYHQEGYNYGDCGNQEYRSFDVCPKCFEEKLVPWFATQGAVLNIRNEDW